MLDCERYVKGILIDVKEQYASNITFHYVLSEMKRILRADVITTPVLMLDGRELQMVCGEKVKGDENIMSVCDRDYNAVVSGNVLICSKGPRGPVDLKDEDREAVEKAIQLLRIEEEGSSGSVYNAYVLVGAKKKEKKKNKEE